MAKSERKAQLLKDYEAKIAQVNQACAKGTNADVESKLQELINIEKEFRSIRESEVFAGLSDTHQAIELHQKNIREEKRYGKERTESAVAEGLRGEDRPGQPGLC